MNYCKKIIEVDFPIKRISENASREKNIRQGHISNLHIWWARRPLAACRAVLCASLWPDPADNLCPESFRNEARLLMREWLMKVSNSSSPEVIHQFVDLQKNPEKLNDNIALRRLLLDYIVEFSNWDNCVKSQFIEISQKLTRSAYQSLTSSGSDKPLVVDPFSGGGAISFEALRVGAEAFASDLNPLAVLLNKVILEYLPVYGEPFVKGVENWGNRIKKEAEEVLNQFYPIKFKNLTPIAYLWARTIKCEGPGCGFTIPMIKKYGITERGGFVSLVPIVDHKNKTINFSLHKDKKRHQSHNDGNVKRGKAICQNCGWTIAGKAIQKQLSQVDGGANTSKLLAVVFRDNKTSKREVYLPDDRDFHALERANKLFESKKDSFHIPTDIFPVMSGVFNAPLYGMDKWYKLYTKRQLVVLNIYFKKLQEAQEKCNEDSDMSRAIFLCVALAIGNMAHYNTSVSTYTLDHMLSAFIQGQAIPMKWDFAEANPLMDKIVGGFEYALEKIITVLNRNLNVIKAKGHVQQADACKHPLPNDSCYFWFTDPPYYNSVPYADLSDFFLVWYSPFLKKQFPELLSSSTSPKNEELCEMAGWDPKRYSKRDKKFYEHGMRDSFKRAREICRPDGIGTVVFAHKSTEGWEALLRALIDAGWVCTASWPLDTENTARMRAHGAATLSSSVHIVCRPRERDDGTLITDYIGDWRDILQELPKRIHDWMPRLAREGVVGADAIFACLGPALEIFSKYSHVEKANGEKVGLREYLEQVWAAVAKEALIMIFEGASAEGFEEDSRLTAMWLWTLSTSANGNGKEKDVSNTEEDEDGSPKAAVSSGFSLEFDAARKIAQGLGAHLENLSNLIEIKGDKARLLPVSERVKSLFGKDSAARSPYKRKKKENQLTLFDELKTVQEEDWSLGDKKAQVGKTVLDRLHQSMILFGSGRGEALRRFLTEEGVGKDERFWRLAQALSALYPSSTDEKRWVDGVLAKKKSFGF